MEHVANAFVTRLKVHSSKRARYVALDLRGEKWGERGIIAVRNPLSTGWPRKGETTTDLSEAETWVRVKKYSAWLQQICKTTRKAIASSTKNKAVNVEAAADSYLEHLRDTKGEKHNTFLNRRSAIERHIKPKWKGTPLLTLEREPVRNWLNGLNTARDNRPLAPRTKENVLCTLSEIWQHALESDAPFAGIGFTDMRASARRTAAAREGDLDALLKKKAYEPEEFFHVLVEATVYDALCIAAVPNVAVRVLPNTAGVIVLQASTSARIAEAMDCRWKFIDYKHRTFFVPGTKSENAPRLVPLQECLIPWLDWLAYLRGGDPNPENHILCTHPRKAGRPSQSTYESRIARILRRADLKLDGEATHIFRACFATWAATTQRVTKEWLKYYIGHSNPYGGATGDYVQIMRAVMSPEHRTLIEHIPGPKLVFARALARLEEFAPEKKYQIARKSKAITIVQSWIDRFPDSEVSSPVLSLAS